MDAITPASAIGPTHPGALPGTTTIAVKHELPAVDQESNRMAGADVAEAIGIGKAYAIGGERRQVLDRIDFRVSSGECVFLAGPSGSGKSTLLSILGCLLAPDEGELWIRGRRVDALNAGQRTEIRRTEIGFVFQRFQLIRGLSAVDNVAVPLGLRGVPLEAARQQAAVLLDQVGLKLHRHALPSSMSPGQCQRVALARAVIAQPKLLLADEPTAALDSASGAEVMNLMTRLIRSTGAAAVVVTHDPRIHRYADRICEIENGRLK